jgi:hypothetical protein
MSRKKCYIVVKKILLGCLNQAQSIMAISRKAGKTTKIGT